MPSACYTTFIGVLIIERENKRLRPIINGYKIRNILILFSTKMETHMKKNAQDMFLTLRKALHNENYLKALDKVIQAQKNYLKQKYNNG